MKNIIFNVILLSFFGSCSAQIKVNEMEKQRAIKSGVNHFFTCMVSNDYYEKIAKNNYYIFDTTGDYLYYGKIHSGFFKGKITDIFKFDIETLQKQIPNFRKLHGTTLREIVLSDIAKENKNFNKSAIIVKKISYQLTDVIMVSIVFVINKQEQQRIYKLNTTNFGIINFVQSDLLLNTTDGAYLTIQQ